ncbi:MAG: DUF1772 domain-containing protein [Burkholderiaceae bacterium]
MHPPHPSLPNRLSPLSLGCQALSLLAMGIMAGFFWTYSINVNLAMLEMDGPVYATVQSAFNRHVRHPLFFAFFFGPAPLAFAAMATSWSQRQRTWWRLLGLAALGYALGIVWFTKAVNLPLNHTTESWSPSALPVDWAATRDAWNRANDWRAIASGALFVLATLAFGLRLHNPAPRSAA